MVQQYLAEAVRAEISLNQIGSLFGISIFFCLGLIVNKGLVGGVGVVAGEEAYKKLNGVNTVLMWE